MHCKRIETCQSQREKIGEAGLQAQFSASVSLKIVTTLCALSVFHDCETINQDACMHERLYVQMMSCQVVCMCRAVVVDVCPV